MGVISKIIESLSKSVVVAMTIFFVSLLVVLLFLFSTDWCWPEFNGSHDLGNGIYALDWDNDPHQIIVKGTSFSGRTCNSGDYLIPLTENHYDSLGQYKECVVKIKHNDLWILARTDDRTDGTSKYYIVDKSGITDEKTSDEIVENHIISFADSVDFFNECRKKNISIEWK